jgi:hypothetical protein
MPQLGFEPTTPVSERAKTAHALDRAASVIQFPCTIWENSEFLHRENVYRVFKDTIN